MTRALLASAVVMDAAGWMCAAQGAYGLARVCCLLLCDTATWKT